MISNKKYWVAVLLIILVAVIIMSVVGNKTSLELTNVNSIKSSTTLDEQSKPYVPENRKVVSIPKPMVLAKSSELKPRKLLLQPTVTDEQAQIFASPSNQKNTEQSNNEFRVEKSVVDKISKQTGISSQEMERAMTREVD